MGALSSSVLLGTPGLAQITSDGSLGVESSVVTPGATVQGLPADLIEGGAARGANLFHSFSDFNVNAGQSVYFANPTGIENILSRVTGGNVSTIDGLLGVDGSANLFLLNPNGVVFGPNASLDISGSFVASTGSSFAFADGSEFNAAPPTNEVLTVSVPLGVQFNNQGQGNITNQGDLAVVAGETLTLLGNVLTLQGASSLVTESGTIQLFGNQVELEDSARVDVSGDQGGQVLIEGDEVTLEAGEIDISGTDAGGALTVAASDELRLGVTVAATGGGSALFDIPTLGIDADAATTIVDIVEAGGTSTLSASETINVDDPITATSGTGGTLAFVDGNSDNNLTINLNALIDLGVDHSLTSEGNTVNVGATTSGIVQNALDVAAVGATVNVAAGTYYEGAQLTLTRDVTLSGDGPATVLDGSNGTPNIDTDDHRVLWIDSGVTAEISDLTITNGVADNGGGIYNDDGTLFINEGTTISHNTAVIGGGGVFNRGVLTIRGGTISHNTSISGGGIHNIGTLVITEGTISHNNTAADGSGIYNSGLYNNGTLTITGGIISHNKAGLGNDPFSYGGGIYNTGTLRITGGTISYNTIGNNIYSGRGGGIYNIGPLRITGGTISHNKAGYGGGVSNYSDDFSLSTMIVTGGTISHNTASYGGGGIYNNNEDISNNSSLRVTGGTISHNTASYGSGGGIYNTGRLTITGGTISGNTTSSLGGGIYSGVSDYSDGTLTITGGTISNNTANSNGDGIYTSIPTTTISSTGQLTITQDIFSSPNALNPTPLAVGNIRLISPVGVILRNGVQITSSTRNSGSGGSIRVETPRLTLQEGSALEASTSANGSGGNIFLNVEEPIIFREQSLINTRSSSATNAGTAGNVIINTPFLIGVPGNNTDILATAVSSGGGQVVINAIEVLGFTPTSEANFNTLRSNGINDISVGSQGGSAGTLNLNTLNVDLTQGLNELPVDLSDRSNQIAPGCGIANTDDGSSFVITGRGGLPPNPSDPIAANDIEVDWLTYDDSDAISPIQPLPDPDDFTQAQAMVIAPDGTVHFVAEAGATPYAGLPSTCALTVHQ